MHDRTDRHFRALLRRLTRRTLLYTEMIPVAGASRRFELACDVSGQRPVVLQLGGSDPWALAELSSRAERLGYDEVNLNCGCPSPAASAGTFGARLMRDPDLVAACVERMRSACSIPVTVKHRIGVDAEDSFEHLLAFVDRVAQSGCDGFVVHARKAWLSGVSPKANRERPPLRPHDVHALKRERPHLRIEMNGGISSLGQAVGQLPWVDGVMIGRAAYDDPGMLACADRTVFEDRQAADATEAEIAAWLLEYCGAWLASGGRLHDITRHALGLFSGRPGAKRYRRVLAEEGSRAGAGLQVLTRALAHVQTADAPRTGV